jgi:hypothetical protein
MRSGDAMRMRAALARLRAAQVAVKELHRSGTPS